jgi:hypothetical protein
MPDHNTFVISVSHVDNHAPRQAVTPGVTADGRTVHAVVRVPHPGTGPRGGGARGSKGAASATTTAVRMWNVMPGPGLDEYQVTDYGAKGLEAVRDGVAVWCGKRTKGGYETTSTTITSPELLTKLLTCIAAADEGRKEAESSPAPAAKAPRQRGRRANAKKTPSEAAANSRPAAGGRGKRGRRAGTKPVSAKGKTASEPRRSQRAEPAPPTQRATAGASSTSQPGKGRGRGRHKPAAGPAPASGERVTIQLPDDEIVLAGVRAKVEKKEKDSAKAEQLFGVLKRIWLAGGREKTIAWMQAHGVKNAVDAFDAWVSGHMDEARAMLA